MKIKEISKENRPRERLKNKGVKSLSDIELLALIIQVGTKKENVIQLSTRIISKYGLKKLSEMSYQELKQIKGIGKAKASKLVSIFEIINRLEMKEIDLNKVKLNSSERVYKMLKNELRSLKQEKVFLITLDTQNKLINKRIVFKGSLNESVIHPREIYNNAIKDNSCSIIIAHNHPSGSLRPSQNDIEITKRIKEVGKIIGIELLDHLIVTEKSYFSFREERLVI